MEETELAFAGIARQAELLRAGEVTSAQLVELYLTRIERINPRLNAFTDVFADRAREAAAAADARIAAGEQAPLLGVPVALKDELEIEGLVTQHGTRAYSEPSTTDSAQWRRLRDAGAVLLARTTLPELAIVGFTETEAWGETRNPWGTGHTTGGSSGGSAAAVAAGLVGAASASDGGGSIRIPAANCGLFGLKPQRGRVSQAPLAQHWLGLTSSGCVSRRVADTALWLDVVAGARARGRGRRRADRGDVQRGRGARARQAPRLLEHDRRPRDPAAADRPRRRGGGRADRRRARRPRALGLAVATRPGAWSAATSPTST